MAAISREEAQKALQARQTQQAIPGGQPINIPGFGPLTAQTVAQAQLFAPPKQAAALSKAFDLIQKTKTKDAATPLRKEFRKETNDIQFKKIRSQYDKIMTAEKTPAGDLSMIFTYMKILDPTSVVREGEQATAENTKGVPGKIRNLYNKVSEGRRLTDRQRGNFQSQAGSLYNTTAKRQKEINAFYSGLAAEAGVDPQDVIGAVGGVELADVQPITDTEIKETFGPMEYLTRALKGELAIQEEPQTGLEKAASSLGPLGTYLTRPDIFRETARPATTIAATLLGPSIARKVTGGIGKILRPEKAIGAKRDVAALKAAAKGVRIEGEPIAKAVVEAAESAPVTARKSARRFALEAIDKYSGKQFTPQQALADKIASWRAGFTASGPSKTAAGHIERAVGSEIKRQIAQKAPDVAASDKLFSLLYKGSKKIKKGTWNALKTVWLGRGLGF